MSKQFRDTRKRMTLPASWLERIVGQDNTDIGNFTMTFSNTSEKSESLYYNVLRRNTRRLVGQLRISNHWHFMKVDGHAITGPRRVNEHGRVINVFHGVSFLGYPTCGKAFMAELRTNRRYTYRGMIGVITFFRKARAV